MMGDRFCCCHVVTGAAIVGMIQLIFIVGTLSTAGTILSRWETWYSWYEESDMEADMYEWKQGVRDEMEAASLNGKTLPPLEELDRMLNETMKDMEEDEGWRAIIMELQLAGEIGFCAVWLVALLAYAAAFRYWKAVFVLPNLILQFMLLIGTFFAIVLMSVHVAELQPPKAMEGMEVDGDRGRGERHALAVIGLVLTVVVFLVEIVFTVAIHKFYKHLRTLAGLVFPGLPPVAVPDKAGYDNMAS